MNFHIADSFTAALAKLTGQEQKQAKTAAFDLQVNPSQPGLQMHRLTNGRDPNFWSVRVNQDIRIIIHRTEASFMLAYVDHHDKAYAWAERRRIEEHPRTRAIQIVEVHERIEDVGALFVQPVATTREEPARAVEGPPVFAALSADELLDVGTPGDWVNDIRTWSEERFFEMGDRLPPEVAERLLDYVATGRLPVPEPPRADPYQHPDTLRRVQTITTEDELRLALDYPWERWSVFLHPSQRAIVERDFSGPARVTGTAGTGKTVVALHRAARAVQEDAGAKVLLTSFSRPLANALRAKLGVLLEAQPSLMSRVSVASFEDAAAELYQLLTGRRASLASEEVQRAAIERAVAETGYTELPVRFVFAEWRQVVDAWNIGDVEGYASVPRIGRRNRLGAKQRENLWPVFVSARQSLATRGLMTSSQMYAFVGRAFADRSEKPFTHVIADEAQDLAVTELRMMGVLAAGPNSHVLAGDIGQRIFQLPFSWRSLGVDVRGRSSSLRINYRTSRQIREAADRLLPPKVRDVDGIEDDRTGAQSVFEGPVPAVSECDSAASEAASVAAFLRDAVDGGLEPEEIGVFVRANEHLGRAREAAQLAGLGARQLTERAEAQPGCVSIGTMHYAKGLEFKVVAVMACDDEALPLQARVAEATDEDELREVFNTERHLFYVACTRARDRLHVSGVKPVSDFLADLG